MAYAAGTELLRDDGLVSLNPDGSRILANGTNDCDCCGGGGGGCGCVSGTPCQYCGTNTTPDRYTLTAANIEMQTAAMRHPSGMWYRIIDNMGDVAGGKLSFTVVAVQHLPDNPCIWLNDADFHVYIALGATEAACNASTTYLLMPLAAQISREDASTIKLDIWGLYDGADEMDMYQAVLTGQDASCCKSVTSTNVVTTWSGANLHWAKNGTMAATPCACPTSYTIRLGIYAGLDGVGNPILTYENVTVTGGPLVWTGTSPSGRTVALRRWNAALDPAVTPCSFPYDNPNNAWWIRTETAADYPLVSSHFTPCAGGTCPPAGVWQPAQTESSVMTAEVL